jgi:hypothetical protein
LSCLGKGSENAIHGYYDFWVIEHHGKVYCGSVREKDAVEIAEAITIRKVV